MSQRGSGSGSLLLILSSLASRASLTYVDIYSRFHLMKKRTTVWLPDKLLARLKKLSRKTGAPMAELFRRAVEAYLKRF